MTQESHHDDIIPNGGQIVERFGGIRPMASKLNVPVTTVQGWKKRDAIPAIRRDEILNAARRYDVQVKDLVGESANENAPGYGPSEIAEDPALTRVVQDVPAPDSILTGSPVSHRAQAAQVAQRAQTAQAQTQTQRKVDTMTQAPQNTAPKRENVTPIRETRETLAGVDMRQVRKSARRTSLMTSAGLVILAAAAGYLLFGQSGSQDAARITAIDSRVTTLEQARSTDANTASTVKTLQEQVGNITSVIGSSAEGLAQMAREVTAGTNAPLTQRLAVLEAQIKSVTGSAGAPALSALSDRMEAMAASPQGKVEWQSAINDLRATVAGLSGRTDQIDTALQEARTENDALGRTLSQVSGNDVGAGAMLLALTNLRTAVDRQAPFQEDLETLKAVSGADPQLAESLDKLAPYAQSGIMSPEALKGALQDSANDIITAKLRGEDVSVKEKIMLHLKSLMSIRKDGESDGTGSEQDLINTATKQLDAGDVAGAMATLQQLQGPSAQAAAPWQQQAQATLTAQVVDTNLVNAIVQKVKTGLATAAAPMSSLPGVVNAGPINMAPSAPAPEAMQPSAPITQTPPPQTMAPMEPQNVPGNGGAQALPRTEPQAGMIESEPTLVPPQPTVTIQQ